MNVSMNRNSFGYVHTETRKVIVRLCQGAAGREAAGNFLTKQSKLRLELNLGLRIHRVIYHTRSTKLTITHTRTCNDNCKNMNVTGTSNALPVAGGEARAAANI